MRFPPLCVCVCVRLGHSVTSTRLILPPEWYHVSLSCHSRQINVDSEQAEVSSRESFWKMMCERRH